MHKNWGLGFIVGLYRSTGLLAKDKVMSGDNIPLKPRMCVCVLYFKVLYIIKKSKEFYNICDNML